MFIVLLRPPVSHLHENSSTTGAVWCLQLAGSLSDPPWARCVDLQYEPQASAYVGDLLSLAETDGNKRDANRDKGAKRGNKKEEHVEKDKDIQFKFIVDGQWKLEPTLPVCQASRKS